jgi:hypothetical protein
VVSGVDDVRRKSVVSSGFYSVPPCSSLPWSQYEVKRNAVKCWAVVQCCAVHTLQSKCC